MLNVSLITLKLTRSFTAKLCHTQYQQTQNCV